MGYGFCAICEKMIVFGPVIVAGVADNKATSFAHGQCWVDSGRPVIGPEEIRLILGAAALPAFDETQPENHVRDAVRANQ